MGKKLVSNAEIHRQVHEALQASNGALTHKIVRFSREVNGVPILNTYALASTRVVQGKPFFGYGSWQNYLEKYHKVSLVDAQHWSDERVHWSIALLLQQFPRRAVNWVSNYDAPVLHGKTLGALYRLAYRSNATEGAKNGERFFGHGNWKKYVAWLKQKYGDKV